MASILEFRKSVFRLRPLSGHAGVLGSADIVIFPGVRYERWSDEASTAPAATSGHRQRRRDRLELDD